jgi:hypothetical protein
MKDWTNAKLRYEMNKACKAKQDAYCLNLPGMVRFQERKITNLSREMDSRGM